MTLQESPGTIPPGRLPRHKEVILLWDLIDSARPGEEVEVTGIYRNNFDIGLNARNGFPVFATIIEAVHVGKTKDEFATFRLTEDDVKKIRALAKDERIGKRVRKYFYLETFLVFVFFFHHSPFFFSALFHNIYLQID